METINFNNNLSKVDKKLNINNFIDESDDFDYFTASGSNVNNKNINKTDDCINNQNKMLREQDRFLPIANISRIMKTAVPKTGKIAKDAKECVQECVSEFISFITSEAIERCITEKRKTLNGEDILFAMSTLGFDNYIDPLKIFLQKYRKYTRVDKPLGQLDNEE